MFCSFALKDAKKNLLTKTNDGSSSPKLPRKTRQYLHIAKQGTHRPLDFDPKSYMRLSQSGTTGEWTQKWLHYRPAIVDVADGCGQTTILIAASQKHIRQNRKSKKNNIYMCALILTVDSRSTCAITLAICPSEIVAPAPHETDESIQRRQQKNFERRMMEIVPWRQGKIIGGQFFVDEIKSQKYVILYGTFSDIIIITVIHLFENGQNLLFMEPIRTTLTKNEMLEFEFGRNYDCIVAKKLTRDFPDRIMSVDYIIPLTVSGNRTITGSFDCVAKIPREHFSRAIMTIKNNPDKFPLQAIEILRRAGKFGDEYLGKSRSFRFYAEFASTPARRILEGIFALTRTKHIAKCIVLATGLTEKHFAAELKDWQSRNPGGVVQPGQITLLKSGTFLHRTFYGRRNDDGSRQMEWFQCFYTIGVVPEQLLKTCSQCKKSETVEMKICRLCKTNGRHLTWWKFPCHFCSENCFKTGWNQHKKDWH